MGRGCSTGCGTAWGSTPCCAGSPQAPAEIRSWERVLVALVANRALARRQSWPPPRGSPTTYTSRAQTVSDDAYYRAMDWLIAVEPQLARGMFNAVADLQPRGRSDLSSTPPAPTSRPKTRFFGKHEYGFDTPPIYRGVQGAYSKPDKLTAFPRVKDNLEKVVLNASRYRS